MDALKADTAHVPRAFSAARGAQKLSAASLARRLSAIRQFSQIPVRGRLAVRQPGRWRSKAPRRSAVRCLSFLSPGRSGAPDREHAREGLESLRSAPLRERAGRGAPWPVSSSSSMGRACACREALSLKKAIANSQVTAHSRARQGANKERLGAALRSCSRRDQARFRASLDQSFARRDDEPLALPAAERERPHDASGLRARSSSASPSAAGIEVRAR